METAAGNPLALIELPITLGADAETAGPVASTAIPLTARLERAFVSRLADMPSGTSSALLVTAADDGGALIDVPAATSILRGTEVWSPP